MKKVFFSMFMGLFLFLAVQETQAQCNFFNNTGCWVRVQGMFSNSPTPCTVGPYCMSPWIAVAPFGVGVLPAGNCPLAPAPNSNYIRIQINFGGGFFGTGICGGAPTPVFDCTGAARTLQMFNFNNAGVF